MASSSAAEANDAEDDDTSIDNEQLIEYEEMVEDLGQSLEKVKINSLTVVAEDFSDSKTGATAIYNIIRDRLLRFPPEKLLPLVYVVDSILKNAKGHYISVVQEDAANWIPVVHKQLSDEQRARMKKVWKTWNDTKLFSTESLKAMGGCFDESVSGKSLSSSTVQVAGINRTKDGTLLLPKALRVEMQNILHDLQRDVTEMEKVSLERLADVNPSLLANIRDTAQQNIQSISNNANQQPQKDESELPDFFTETRSPAMLEQAAAWKDHAKDVFKEALDASEALRAHVDLVYQERYTQAEALEMTQYVATASAVAAFLAQAVELVQKEEQSEKTDRRILPGASSSGFRVDPELFTNDGIKKKNSTMVGLLYEVGLPFQSSADGRRFRTQLELSKHLDALFKRAQLEKSITRAEERGWFVSESVWQGEEEEFIAQTTLGQTSGANDSTTVALQDGYDPETSTMPADESRDRCAICGLNFKMFFDNEEGIYSYKNCREIEVLNDEVALDESEQMLVHVTCWRALGSPEVLTMDQALQDTVRH